jgi:ferrochelatase
MSMASTSDYVVQLEEACGLVAGALGRSWRLVYQSRSGPPSQPWLEPDVSVALEEVVVEGHTDVVVAPIGFVSDHMEVLFDLDTEARELCESLGLNLVRAGTAGTHPQFVSMIRELIAERTGECPPRCLGHFGPRPDFCPEGCCPAPVRPGRPV